MVKTHHCTSGIQRNKTKKDKNIASGSYIPAENDPPPLNNLKYMLKPFHICATEVSGEKMETRQQV